MRDNIYNSILKFEKEIYDKMKIDYFSDKDKAKNSETDLISEIKDYYKNFNHTSIDNNLLNVFDISPDYNL